MKPDALRFIQITDTHLLGQADALYHGINTRDNLKITLASSLQQHPDADFVLFTGDISQNGDKESYAIFADALSTTGLPVYGIPGNHDDPQQLQQVLPDSPDDAIRIVQKGDYSLILISSYIPDVHQGRVSERSLQQLDEYLENNPELRHIIAIHHPPTLVNSEWLDELGLLNRDELLQVINKYSDEALLVSGHVHQEVDQQLDNARLLATPSTCRQFTPNCDAPQYDEPSRPAYRVVTIDASGSIETQVHYVGEEQGSGDMAA